MHKWPQYPIAEEPRGDGKVEARMLVQPALDQMRVSLENSYLVFPPTNIYSLCSSFCDAQTFQWSTWHWLLHKFPLTLPNFLNLTQPLTSESYCLASVWSTTRLTSQEADEIGGSKIFPSGKGFWSHSVFSRSCTGVGTMTWWSYGGNMVTSPDALTL